MEPHVAFADDAANATALAAVAAAEHPIHQVLRTCGITNATSEVLWSGKVTGTYHEQIFRRDFPPELI